MPPTKTSIATDVLLAFGVQYLMSHLLRDATEYGERLETEELSRPHPHPHPAHISVAVPELR